MNKRSLIESLTPERSFVDPAIEESFRRRYVVGGLRWSRLALLLGAFLACAFWVLLVVRLPDSGFSGSRQIIRLSIALLLLVVATLSYLWPRIALRHYVVIFGAPAAVACLAIGVIGFLPSDFEDQKTTRLTTAMVVACWLIYGFCRLPPKFVALVCTFGSAVTVLGAMLHEDEYLNALILYLLLANLTGWAMCVGNERNARALFASSVRLTRMARKLEASARASEEASAAKSHVLAAVSHDLRQPLTSMSLYMAALRESVSKDEPRVVRAIGQIDECVAAMSDNLSKLSNIAELQDRDEALPVETIDLLVLLRRLSSVYGGQADRKGVRLVVRLPEPGGLLAASDGARLWEILSNLVSNAIKFSGASRPGWVLVRATSLAEALRVTIRDNGVGIDPRFHRRVFDEYFQVGNPQRDREKGYGLGLSIVRETVSRLSGHRLCMRSGCGQGTRFDLFVPRPASDALPLPAAGSTLPAHLPAATDAAALDTTAGAIDRSNALLGRYALLVEDDAATRQALTETMEGWGMLVEAVGSPDEAMIAVRQAERFFDVVVSDFNLPGATDGVALVDAVRVEQGQRTPAIIVSGRLAAIDPGRLGKVDTRTMAKPLDPVQLRSELEACVAA